MSPSLLIQLSTVIETTDGRKGVVKRIMVDAEDTFEDTVKAVEKAVRNYYHAPLNGVSLSWDGSAVRIYGRGRDGILEDIGSIKEGLI